MDQKATSNVRMKSLENVRKYHNQFLKPKENVAIVGSSKVGQEDNDHCSNISSAGVAATLLKYADLQDLPVSPSRTRKPNDAAVGGSVSYVWDNQSSSGSRKSRSSNHPIADVIPPKDRKKFSPSEPRQNAQGANVALFTHKNNIDTNVWKPDNSRNAANIAFQREKNRKYSSPIDYGHTGIRPKDPLLAATSAISISKKKSGSSSNTSHSSEADPSNKNAVLNALHSPTAISSPSGLDTSVWTGGSTSHVKMPQKLHTSYTSIYLKPEERNNTEDLHTKAAIRAQEIHSIDGKHIDTAPIEAAVHKPILFGNPEVRHSRRVSNFQEAARRLAQQSLPRLYESSKNRQLRDYHSGSNPAPSKHFPYTMRGHIRGCSVNDAIFDEDWEQRNLVLKQVSVYPNEIPHVDVQKIKNDREAIFAAAQCNVCAYVQGIDGKYSPETRKDLPNPIHNYNLEANAPSIAPSRGRMAIRNKLSIRSRSVDQGTSYNLIKRKPLAMLDQFQGRVKTKNDNEMQVFGTEEREKEAKSIRKKILPQCFISSEQTNLSTRKGSSIEGEHKIRKIKEGKLQGKKNGKSKIFPADCVVATSFTPKMIEPTSSDQVSAPLTELGPDPICALQGELDSPNPHQIAEEANDNSTITKWLKTIVFHQLARRQDPQNYDKDFVKKTPLDILDNHYPNEVTKRDSKIDFPVDKTREQATSCDCSRSSRSSCSCDSGISDQSSETQIFYDSLTHIE